MSDVTQQCPICSGPAGPYRLGACGPGCDQVMGSGSNAGEVVALVLVVAALILAALVVLA